MEKVYKPLRSVRVTYSNGDKVETSVNGELTDKEIHDYFEVGKPFNLGNVSDNVQTVVKCEILKYYIGARSAWDTVMIGYFDSEEDAKKYCDGGSFSMLRGGYVPYSHSTIKSKYV